MISYDFYGTSRPKSIIAISQKRNCRHQVASGTLRCSRFTKSFASSGPAQRCRSSTYFRRCRKLWLVESSISASAWLSSGFSARSSLAVSGTARRKAQAWPRMRRSWCWISTRSATRRPFRLSAPRPTDHYSYPTHPITLPAPTLPTTTTLPQPPPM